MWRANAVNVAVSDDGGNAIPSLGPHADSPGVVGCGFPPGQALVHAVRTGGAIRVHGTHGRARIACSRARRVARRPAGSEATWKAAWNCSASMWHRRVLPLPGGPIVTFMRFVAPVAIWFTLKRVMLASTVALAVSGHRLACVAAGATKSSSKTKKAIVWSGAAVATAAVVAGAILSLLWRTPLLFVVCCALAVSIVNAQLFLDMSIHNRTRTWWG